MAYSTQHTWVASETVTAALLNTHVRDNFIAVAGSAGFTGTPSATRGIEPTAGYFMGGALQNYHVEGGTVTFPSSTSVGVTYANAFAAAPILVCSYATGGAAAELQVTSISASTACIGAAGASTQTVYWIAIGSDT